MGLQMCFERFEKKFVLQAAQYVQIIGILEKYMTADDYGSYTICSMYYDTDTYDFIRHSITKPAFKEKLRLRSYGTPKADSKVFLELKKKFKGVTYKRRIPLTYKAAMDYLERGELPAVPQANTQILQELHWFINRYKPTPKVLLCYERNALCGKKDPNLRITFDRDIRWRNKQLLLSKGCNGHLLLPKGTHIMEIKVNGVFPLWLTHILTELQLYSRSFSKYGTVYTRHLMQAQKEEILHVG